MNKCARAFALIVCLTVAACATQYQPRGLTGGFDETQLDRNVYRVSFKGNGFTSSERASDLVLLRCAELTLNDGYNYFAIVDAQQATKLSTFTTPTQSVTTTNASGTAYQSGNTIYGSVNGVSHTTTYGGETIVIAKPSATNTIVMVHNRSDIPAMVYDAHFLYDSLRRKYGIGK